jgi:hypothetical protein
MPLRSKGASQATFEVQPGRSAVLVKARSNVGPISFATSEVRGSISAEVDGSRIDVRSPVSARITVSLTSLTSGNTLYDTELKRRIDARRYPDAVVELREAARAEDGAGGGGGSSGTAVRYHLVGAIEIHDIGRSIEGSVTVESTSKGVLIVRGQQTIDIREFDLEVPTTLALKIYPEVAIEMHLEARAK